MKTSNNYEHLHSSTGQSVVEKKVKGISRVENSTAKLAF